eukprot:m.266712 g.266712  ORF g.266712 m.266712 type:complete len:348 (+) comp68783_c0_seq1:72-1115(+)
MSEAPQRASEATHRISRRTGDDGFDTDFVHELDDKDLNDGGLFGQRLEGTIDGTTKKVITYCILLGATLSFSFIMVAATQRELTIVDPWFDEDANEGKLMMGPFDICFKPPNKKIRCYPYEDKRAHSFLTRWRAPGDPYGTNVSSSDDCNCYFSTNADEEDTGYCHVRRSVAAFLVLGIFTNFFGGLFSIAVWLSDHPAVERIAIWLYLATTVFTLIALATWKEFLNDWNDAALATNMVKPLGQGSSTQYLVGSTVLSGGLVILDFTKLYFTRHGDHDPNEKLDLEQDNAFHRLKRKKIKDQACRANLDSIADDLEQLERNISIAKGKLDVAASARMSVLPLNQSTV